MPFTKALIAAAAIYFAVGANAHMKLLTPAPYGAATLNNSPLDKQGADFPCKQRDGVYADAASTATMPVGAKQTLSFQGQATHGGGSCQVSLTSAANPGKDAEWKVIHSILGGCPTSQPGNLGDDASATNPTTFEYSIPDGIAAGKYTLAWTWFNKVGNREMYMNCAPIVVTGGKKRSIDSTEVYTSDEQESSYNETAEFELTARDTSFPSMFVANIGNGCTTVDSQDVLFPEPGSSVQKAGVAAAVAPSGNCGSSKAAAGATTSGGSASGSDSGAQAVSPSPSAAAGGAAAGPSAASPGTATILASPSATPETPTAGTGSTSSSGGMTCSPDGKSFRLPGGPLQPVALGTSCKNSQITFAKRSAKFAKAFNS